MKLKIIIIIEIVMTLTILIVLFTMKQKVLGEQIQIIPQEKKNFEFVSSTNLKYFYEPKKDTQQVDDISWLGKEFTFKPVYSINSDSLNERFNYEYQKPDKVYRIITIGDSGTFGLLVNTEENYPEKLEDLLNSQLTCRNIKKFEVINLGVGGYDIEYAVERYKKRGIKYNPDLIIWLIKDTNFSQINEQMFPIKNKCKEEAKLNMELSKKEKENFYYCWNYAVNTNKDYLGATEMVKYLSTKILELNKYFFKKLVVLNYANEKEANKSMMRSFSASRENIYFYDSLVDIKKLKMVYPDGHPTTQGYIYIAGDINNYMIQNKIIPCE